MYIHIYVCVLAPSEIVLLSTATGYMDFTKDSFVEWKTMSPCQSTTECSKESFKTEIQISFRSRDPDNNGLLFYVRGNSGTEYIKIMVC